MHSGSTANSSLYFFLRIGVCFGDPPPPASFRPPPAVVDFPEFSQVGSSGKERESGALVSLEVLFSPSQLFAGCNISALTNTFLYDISSRLESRRDLFDSTLGFAAGRLDAALGSRSGVARLQRAIVEKRAVADTEIEFSPVELDDMPDDFERGFSFCTSESSFFISCESDSTDNGFFWIAIMTISFREEN